MKGKQPMRQHMPQIIGSINNVIAKTAIATAYVANATANVHLTKVLKSCSSLQNDLANV